MADTFSIARLAGLWRASMVIAALIGAAAFAWGYGEFDETWIVALAAFGLAAIVQRVAFYLLCLWRAPGLGAFIVKDETLIEGDSVINETTVSETGRAELDSYIKAFADARGATMVALGGVLLAAGALAIDAFL